MFRRIVLLLCCASLFGCTIPPLYPLPGDTPMRAHSLGIKVYDASGEIASEGDWRIRGKIINHAWQTLGDCVGFEFKFAAWLIKRVPVIVTPPGKKVEYGGVTGDAGFLWSTVTFFGPGWGEAILVRLDLFTDDLLRHEWIHAYLYFVFGPEAVSNHDHELFKSCERIRGQ